MSEENVEIVQTIYRHYNSGLRASDEWALHVIDPEIEYVNPPYAVEPGVSRGRAALDATREIYPDHRFEVERFIDAADDVAVIGLVRGTSSSGVVAQWRQGHVWTIRDGRAIRFRWFNQPAEALKAVGLEQ